MRNFAKVLIGVALLVSMFSGGAAELVTDTVTITPDSEPGLYLPEFNTTNFEEKPTVRIICITGGDYSCDYDNGVLSEQQISVSVCKAEDFRATGDTLGGPLTSPSDLNSEWSNEMFRFEGSGWTVFNSGWPSQHYGTADGNKIIRYQGTLNTAKDCSYGQKTLEVEEIENTGSTVNPNYEVIDNWGSTDNIWTKPRTVGKYLQVALELHPFWFSGPNKQQIQKFYLSNEKTGPTQFAGKINPRGPDHAGEILIWEYDDLGGTLAGQMFGGAPRLGHPFETAEAFGGDSSQAGVDGQGISSTNLNDLAKKDLSGSEEVTYMGANVCEDKDGGEADGVCAAATKDFTYKKFEWASYGCSSSDCRLAAYDTSDQSYTLRPESSILVGWGYEDAKPGGSWGTYWPGYLYTETTGSLTPPINELETKIKKPNSIYDDTNDEARWYLCDSRLPSTQDRIVYSPDDDPDTANQFICQGSDWERISKCEDGYDNDLDTANGEPEGGIDAGTSPRKPSGVSADPECLDPNFDSESGQLLSTCPEATVGEAGVDTDGDGVAETTNKAAFWNHNPGGAHKNLRGTQCRYENVQLTVGRQNSNFNGGQGIVSEPDTGSINLDDPDGKGHLLARQYYCNVDFSTISSHPILTEYLDITSGISPSSISYDEVVKKYLYNAQDGCRQVTSQPFHGNDQMPMASIQVPERLIPYGPSKFVNEQYGYDPFIIQSLREAENKYFNGVPTSGQLKTAGLNSSLSDIYPSSSPDTQSFSDAEDAWDIGNRFDIYEDDINPVTLYNEDGLPQLSPRTFPGGFAPRCPEGENWGYYGGEWQCQPEFYHYVLPDIKTDTAQDKKQVRLKIPAVTLSRVQSNTEDSISTGELTCWRGNLNEKPSDATTDLTIDYTGTFDLGGYKNIQGDVLPNYDTGAYSCNATFETVGGDTIEFQDNQWVNLWDVKSSGSGYNAGSISDVIGKVVIRNRLNYNECARLMGLQCDIFANISTRDEQVSSDFFETEPINAKDESVWQRIMTPLSLFS